MSLVNTIFDKILRRKEERRRQEERAMRDADEIKDNGATSVLPNNTSMPGGLIYGFLRAARQTEKASGAAAMNQYVFIVHNSANKVGIGRAIESRYGVDVESVTVLNMLGKKRRRGRQIGQRPGFKKAVVKIKQGQKIEIM